MKTKDDEEQRIADIGVQLEWELEYEKAGPTDMSAVERLC